MRSKAERKMIKELNNMCNSRKSCVDCPVGNASFLFCNFFNLPKMFLKEIYDIAFKPTNKCESLLGELKTIKKYCHEHSENNESFCEECKYNGFCCLPPIDWDMHAIEDTLMGDD